MAKGEKSSISMIIAGMFGLVTTIVSVMTAIWAFTPENNASGALSYYIEKHSNDINNNEDKRKKSSQIFASKVTSDDYRIWYSDGASSSDSKQLAEVVYSFWRQYKTKGTDNWSSI